MPTPTITDATITLRGSVNSRVVKVLVDGVEKTLAANKTFSHTMPAPVDQLLTVTTFDAQGLSESRAVRITTTDQSAPVLMPSAPA